MRIVLIIVVMGMLAGCATTAPSSTVPIDVPALPADIAARCSRPVTLPSADTGRQDVERFWATDRANLAKCAAAQRAAVSSYEAVRTALASAAKKSSLSPATGAGARQRSELRTKR